MPAIIKTNKIKIKDVQGEEYIGVDVVAERTAAEIISDIEDAGEQISADAIADMESAAEQYLDDLSEYDVENIVIASDTQPSSASNRLWINEGAEEEYTVPTYEEFSAVSSALNVLDDGNLPIPIIKDSYIKQDGTIAGYPGWDRTDFISCNPWEKFYVTNTTRTVYCFWYASKDVSTKVQQLVIEVGESIITAPAGAYYFIVSNTAAAMASMTIRGLALYSELMSAKVEIEASFDLLKETTPEKNIINRFDKTKITSGKYIDIRNGTLSSGDGFFASDFIYVGDLSSVTVSYTHLFCWYDQNKAWLDENETDMNSGTNDLTYDVPEGAKYLRFSAYNANLDYAQIGHGISRANYIQYGAFTLDGLMLGGDDIIVDANGDGDYTSFTLACKENYGNAKNIVVKPGTYNIVDEYVAIWGQSAVGSMSDADSATFDGWQYGVKMNGRRFTFMPGAKLVCDWTGHTVDGTHRFSALRVEMNVEIIGLDLDGTHLFYVIHDDYGTNDAPYTVAYRNCRVFGHSLTNANCIGGGCKKYSRHIIENCYFDNGGLASSTTVRYHNTNADGAVPELYISNSYFNGWVTPRYYGTQTSKMRAYINNCKAQKIIVIAESGSYTTENVDLFKWCNEEAE